MYWISAEGLIHRINLSTLARTRYMLHPDIEFHDDMRGSGPCAYLSIDHDHHIIRYIFTNPDQVWICELLNLGDDGLIFLIPHDQRIGSHALFVNRRQSALLKEVEDLNMQLEDKILQGPLPNDCQLYNFETNQCQVMKICSHTMCEGLWFLSENLGQEHIHYDYVANSLEHGGGAVVAEEQKTEEEEDVPVVIDKESTVLTRTAVAVQVNGAQKFSQISACNRLSCGETWSPLLSTVPPLFSIAPFLLRGSGYGNGSESKFKLTTPVTLKPGRNDLALLSMTVGLQNAGPFYEWVGAGPTSVKISGLTSRTLNLSSHEWAYKIGLEGEHLSIFSPYQNGDLNWKTCSQPPNNQPLTWYKVIVDTPKGNDPIGLDMQHMGKGQAWLNGYPIGRYWPRASSPNDKCTSTCNYRGKFFPDKCRTGCGEHTQRWYHVPRSWFHPTGKITLVIFEETGGDLTKISFAKRQRKHLS